MIADVDLSTISELPLKRSLHEINAKEATTSIIKFNRSESKKDQRREQSTTSLKILSQILLMKKRLNTLFNRHMTHHNHYSSIINFIFKLYSYVN